MKKKLLIGAGILLTVFLVFLIALCGGATSNKVVTEEELKTIVTNVSCEVKNEENIDYELSTLTNDISFDSEIKNKQYTKIIVNKESGFKSLGAAFIARADEDFDLNISLNKNGTALTTTTINFDGDSMQNVNLLLDESVDISVTDEFTITFEQTADCSFQFDTIIFFFDEV